MSIRSSLMVAARITGVIGMFISSWRYARADVPLTPPPTDRAVLPRNVLTAHSGDIHGLAFSPDGRTLATGGNDGLVKLWDVSSRKLKKTLLRGGGGVWELQFSPDGRTLIGALEDGFAPENSFAPRPKPQSSLDQSLHIAVWNVATGKLVKSFPLRGTEFTGFSLSPNGKLAVVCSASDEHGGQATLWEIQTGKLVRAVNTSDEGRFEAAFAPDNKTVAVGALFHKLQLWNAVSGEVTVLSDSDVVLKFSPDSTLLIGLSDAVGINIRSVPTGKVVRRLEGHDDTVWSFAVSPDKKTLASGGGDLSSDIRLWNIATGKRIATFKGHTKGVPSLAYSPDGRRLVSGGADGTVRFWNLPGRPAIPTPLPVKRKGR